MVFPESHGPDRTPWHAGNGIVGIFERGTVAEWAAKHSTGPGGVGGRQGWPGLDPEVASEHGGEA